MTEQIHYSWQNFNDAVEVIANRVRAAGHLQHLKHIYGVPRGGLVLAVKLSHMLNLPMTDFETLIAEGDALVVDDISDTGTTMKRMNKLAACTATIHVVPGTICMPDIWVEERAKDAWVVYPWEV